MTSSTRMAGILNAVAAILITLTSLRLALVCVTTPILGYANNLDFMRQSACVGVWQVYGDRPKSAAHMEAPVDRLRFDGERIKPICMRSSDNLFVWAVAHWHGKHGVFPLRQVGAARAIAAVLSMLVIVAQPIGASVRLAVSAVFLLVFGDIAVLASFNTLYLDASAIISATMLAAMAVAMDARRSPPPRWLCGFGAMLLLWLGCSKPQFLLLAVLFGAALAWIMWRAWRAPARAGCLAAAGALAPLLFLALNADPRGIFHTTMGANLEDTIMATVLPYAPDKPRALRVLGLPESCLAGLGRTGFVTATTGHNACPQVDVLGRARLLPLFAVAPATLFGPLSLAVDQSRTGAGVLAHFEQAGSAARWPFDVLAATSLTTWLAALPQRLFSALVTALTAGGLACLPVWLARRGAALGLAAAGGMVSAYAYASAVFGDGFVEVARHEALALSGLAFVMVAIGRAGCALAACGGRAFGRGV